MSHFTSVITNFQHLFYLEKALKKLNIPHTKQEKNRINSDSNPYDVNLLIPQSNGHDIEFTWNGQEYELVVDMSFWDQSSTIASFIHQISQKYAGEAIVGESQKIGFQPITYQTNVDGSNTLVLERWNT